MDIRNNTGCWLNFPQHNKLEVWGTQVMMARDEQALGGLEATFGAAGRSTYILHQQ